MRHPLVSIIIPVYNLAPYLPRCIQAVTGQSYPHTEIIVVDDGSTDDSLAVLQQLAQVHENIQVLTQPNAGPGPARNNGLDHAKGDYILFVDGDDWIEPETVAACVTEAEKHQADIVCYGHRTVKWVKDQFHTVWTTQYHPENYINSDFLVSCLAECSLRKDIISTAAWGKLYRRDLIEKHCIRFRIPKSEDTPFVIEAVYYAKAIRCIDGVFYNYLIREAEQKEQSITGARLSEEKIKAFYAADRLVKNFLMEQHIFEQYREEYQRFHNARVVIYGGYFETYVNAATVGKEAHRIMMQQLLENRKALTWHRKQVSRQYRKRIFMLKIGTAIGTVNIATARRFFLFYENIMGLKK